MSITRIMEPPPPRTGTKPGPLAGIADVAKSNPGVWMEVSGRHSTSHLRNYGLEVAERMVNAERRVFVRWVA